MTLYVLLGPTAVGKTELALRMAEQMGSPILNCDSRQLYRDLHIGTAAPTPQQLQRVRHYFVGTLGLQDYYSAARYEADALQLIRQLSTTHPALLLSGKFFDQAAEIDRTAEELYDCLTKEIALREGVT